MPRRARRQSKPNGIVGQFSAYPVDMLASPAWRALSLSARKCLERIAIELANHGGRDNGQLPVTNRNFRAHGIYMDGINPALAELTALGFVEMMPGYACENPAYGRAARFRVLFLNCIGPPPEHRWKQFKTDAEAKAVAKQARAAAMRKRQTKTTRHASPDAPKTGALASDPKTGALSHAPETGALSPSENRSTVYSLGRGRTPAAHAAARPDPSPPPGERDARALGEADTAPTSDALWGDASRATPPTKH